MGWTIKNKEIIRKFLRIEYKLKDFELWALHVFNKEGDEAVFELVGGEFIGDGYITISKDHQEAIDLMKQVNPERDWGLFEIEEFNGYTIVID